MLIDVHAHLTHPRYEDVEKVIERCRKNKVIVVNNGLNPSTNRSCLELARKHPEVIKAALGVYPIDGLNIQDPEKFGIERDMEKVDIDAEIEFIKKNKKDVSAIGEVGIDYKFVKDKNKEQAENLMKFVELAEKLKVPIIVHSRGAEKDVIDLLETSKSKKIIMHFFSGSMKLVKRIEDNGWFISIPCAIDRSQQYQMIAERLNINQIFTETDSPYAPPAGEEINEPSFVKNSIKFIAKIKKMNEEEVEKNIFMNFQKTFLKDS